MEATYSISKEEAEFLLKLARSSIEHYLKTGEILDVDESSVPYKNLKEKVASFVTLETDRGELRGCIGSIVPHIPLYKDVIANAVYAAVSDPRFYPISLQELDRIKIKISILTPPEEVIYTDWKDLLLKIEPYRDGIIVEQGGKTATFLPEVWQTIPDKEMFLSNLCLKAGLKFDCYKDRNLKVFRYRTLSISE